jgi:acyl dehydratase
VRYYEDLEVGVTSRAEADHLVTEEEILEFGRRWDPQPFHTDPEAAAASTFGGLVASTVHLFALLTKLGMTDNELAAMSALGMTDLVNHAPLRPGDRVRHQSTVVEKRSSKSRPGTGIVVMRGMLVNQRDEPVFSAEIASLVHFRPT